MMTIDGVPEKISRADYVRLIESVGLDPKLIRSLTFGLSAITATVIAYGPDGRPVHDGENGAAEHTIVIPVT